MMKKILMSVALCGLLSACSGPRQFLAGDPFAYLGSEGPQSYAGLAAPGQHLVQGGETVYRLSRLYGVSPQAIIQANQLKTPDVLYVGQLLRIPSGTKTAPVAVASAKAPAKAPTSAQSLRDLTGTDQQHVVSAGESLDIIADRNGVTRSQVMALNNITDPNHIQVGQTLRLPAGARPARAPVQDSFPTVASGRVTVEPPKSGDSDIEVASLGETKLPPVATTPVSTQRETLTPVIAKESVSVAALPGQASADARADVSTPTARTEAQTEVTSLARDRDELEKLRLTAKTPSPPLTGQGFVLPVAGKIVVPFGDQANGTRNEGVNIATPSNTPVRASEAGVVSFADEGLNGYGKMIVIRHSDGYLTAYAHNAVNLVELSDIVERGQVIARVGSTGNVSAPQLHFELRRNGSPLDPMVHTATVGQVVANSQ